MAGGAKYSIGPLTTYADAAELARWFDGAAPKHECTYATGVALGRHATAELARRLEGEGKVALVRRRNGRGFDYIIRKLPTATADGCADGDLDPVTARVLSVLAERFAAGVPCPSQAELARLAGLPNRRAAQYRLALLMQRGLVQIETVAGRRQVRVTAKGEAA